MTAYERMIAADEAWVDPLLHVLARSTWQAVMLIGTISFVLGALVLAWPHATLRVAGVLFGIYLVVSGVLQLVAAFAGHLRTVMRVLGFISGALSILLGVFCFRSSLDSVILLALWIGIGWLFRGIIQTVGALSDPEMLARGWMGFFGLVTIAAGIVLIDSPVRSLHVLAVVVGCWLIALGLMEIVTALRLRREFAEIGNYRRRLSAQDETTTP